MDAEAPIRGLAVGSADLQVCAEEMPTSRWELQQGEELLLR